MIDSINLRNDINLDKLFSTSPFHRCLQDVRPIEKGVTRTKHFYLLFKHLAARHSCTIDSIEVMKMGRRLSTSGERGPFETRVMVQTDSTLGNYQHLT